MEKKKIRFYTDVAHAQLMPGFKENSPIWQTFGFDSPADKILVVRVADLTEEEIEEFRKSWKDSVDIPFWHRGQFFGDAYYANRNTPIPNIKNKDAIFECSWKEFYTEGHDISVRMKHFSDYWKKSFDEIDWSCGGKYAV